MSNVIVFMSDEHNPRYSSPCGHDFIDTPNMQWLADRGTVYEHAYCPSPLCMPSRSAFLTGKRVHAVKAYGNNRLGIPPESRGLGAVFVGKVHAYRPVAELGFSETIETNDGPSAFYDAQRRRPLADELENRYQACSPKAEELSAALAGICDPTVEDREAEAAWERQVRLNQEEAAAQPEG